MEETISSAKKSLESKILSSGFVTSIGTRKRGDEQYIQVGVSEEHYIPNIQILLVDGKWEGFPVEVISRQTSIPHK